MSIAATPQVRTVNNFLNGEEAPALGGATFEKLSPATGEVLSLVARSGDADVQAAVAAAKAAAERFELAGIHVQDGGVDRRRRGEGLRGLLHVVLLGRSCRSLDARPSRGARRTKAAP